MAIVVAFCTRVVGCSQVVRYFVIRKDFHQSCHLYSWGRSWLCLGYLYRTQAAAVVAVSFGSLSWGHLSSRRGHDQSRRGIRQLSFPCSRWYHWCFLLILNLQYLAEITQIGHTALCCSFAWMFESCPWSYYFEACRWESIGALYAEEGPLDRASPRGTCGQ